MAKSKQLAVAAEAEQFARYCATHEPEEEAHRAYITYCRMLQRAIGEGVVWVEHRVRALYPVIKEICDEIDAIERREAELERRSKAAKEGWRRRRRAGGG